jgi:hypothetical protein
MPTIVDRSNELKLSPLEKQDKLNALTDSYFRGEMEPEEFLKESRRYNFDFDAFIAELATKRLEMQRLSGAFVPTETEESANSGSDFLRKWQFLESAQRSFLTALLKVLGTK